MDSSSPSVGYDGVSEESAEFDDQEHDFDPSESSEYAEKLEAVYRDIQETREKELKETCGRLGVDDTEICDTRCKSKPIRQLMKDEEEKKEQEQLISDGKADDQTAEENAEDENAHSPQGNTKISGWLPTIKLDAIEAWKELIGAMKEEEVFFEYADSLATAFQEVARNQAPEPDSETDAPNVAWFRHQLNLANLLTHTVKNHQRDNCTECRFVTLLEIVLSYQNASAISETDDTDPTRKWRPSQHVQRFWVRLMQPIEPDIAPMDFRRKAYGVLVSLSWVPSSKGLLEACSIADNRPAQLPPATPLGARQVLQKIPGRPLPRNDSVYQVLDRLKDETNVSVVISGSKNNDITSVGIGKTTVAALVASHHLVLRSFKVLWLKMDYKQRRIGVHVESDSNSIENTSQAAGLNYAEYIEYLDDILFQLGLQKRRNNDTSDTDEGEYLRKGPRWPDESSLKRLEETAIQRRREENLIIEAQAMMSDVLAEIGRNVLLVLDDVSEDNELKWFHFVDTQSILATSQAPVTAADWTVELDPWGEEEAVALFLLESGFPSMHFLASASEVKDIAKQCSYHPVLIRTVARWFKLKKVTSGLILALEEANRTCAWNSNTAVASATRSHPVILPRLFVNVLNRAIGPTVKLTEQPSILFKLCLASMAAVFSRFQPVPLSAVMLLWEQLLTMEPDAIEECGGNLTSIELRKRVWFIAEGLSHCGVLSFSEDKEGDALVSIHHDMYVKYGLRLVVEMDLGEIAVETYAQWHKAFVAAYLTRKFEGNNPESCQRYALQKLPTHMVFCKLYDKVVALLSNGRLYQERVQAFGKDFATNLQVYDCVQLLKHMRRDPPLDVAQQNDVILELRKVAVLLAEQTGTAEESAATQLSKHLYEIGFALAENGEYEEARALYETAQKVVPKSSSFVATILYGLGSMNLILNESSRAMKNFMASLACMKILGEGGGHNKGTNSLYQEVLRRQGEAMIAHCNYSQALIHFEEILEHLKDSGTFEAQIEYGALLYDKARLHQVMGELDRASEELKNCIKWKADHSENTSRALVQSHASLADIYSILGRTNDARIEIDIALKKAHELNAKYGKSEVESIEMKLLKAKLVPLRSELHRDWSQFEEVTQDILARPVLLLDQSAYDLRCIARVYITAGKYEAGSSVLEDALKLMTNRNESLERALCLIDLGNSFLDQGTGYNEDEEKAQTMFQLALNFFELAHKIQKPKLGDCQQVLETLDAIGNLHVNLRQHEKAIAVYKETLSLAMKLRSDNEKIAGILYFLGECYEATGDFDLAEKQYKQCLMGLKADRSWDDIDLARPMQRLGAINLVKAHYQDALKIYDDILRIRQANYEPTDSLIAETLDVLGFLAMRCRDYDRACTYLLDSLKIRKKHDNIRATGDTLFQVGNAYRMLGDSDNALTYLVHSSTTLEGSVDEDDPLLASVALALGSISFSSGNDAEAVDYFEQALSIRKTCLGNKHRKTANASRNLGMAKFLLNKNVDASSLLQDYVRIVEQHANPINRTEYVMALIMLSDVLMASGKHKSAKKFLASARDICKSTELDVPEFVQIVEERRSVPTPSLLTRMQDRQQEEVILEHDPKEIAAFRKVILTDD